MNISTSKTDMPHDVSDFPKEVLERSFDIPVLVDFWAEWCAPCRMLSPILERLAQQNAGKWALAKVNTERLPDVASKYAVQSIPNVKLFVEGKVVGEFVGAQPEYVIMQWLRKNLPSKLQARIDLARTLIAEQREADARTLLENVLAAEPGNQEVKVLLAQLCVFEDPTISRPPRKPNTPEVRRGPGRCSFAEFRYCSGEIHRYYSQ